MKYHVGDMVRIKPLIEFQRSKHRNPLGTMDKYCGRIATIMTIDVLHDGYCYLLDIDGSTWEWFDDMLEDAYDKSTISEGTMDHSYCIDMRFCGVQNQLLRTVFGIVPHSINLIGKRKYLTLKIRS